MDLGLKNRAYVVTGATRGLGLATARELVAEGAHVLVSGRTQDAVDAAVTELAALGTAHGLVADNAGPDTADRLIAGLAPAREETA